MIDVGIVYGNGKQAAPLVIGKDTVYIHTDIQPVTEDLEGNPLEDMYQYNEVQYTMEEYLALAAEQTSELSHLINVVLGVEE